MIRLLFLAVLVVAAGGDALASPAPPQPRPSGQPAVRLAVRPVHDLLRLREWTDAVDRHHPGEPDAAAIGVGAWSQAELEVLFLDLRALLQVITTPDRPKFLSAQRPLLAPRSSVLVVDGQQVGVAYYGAHWDFARLLLDQVMPDPARDITVRQWYRTVAAVFAAEHLLAESRAHLCRARWQFRRGTPAPRPRARARRPSRGRRRRTSARGRHRRRLAHAVLRVADDRTREDPWPTYLEGNSAQARHGCPSFARCCF